LRDRRHFLKTTLSGAGLALTAPRTGWSDATIRPGASAATDLVSLGKTGVKCSFLAFGSGMNGGARASDLTRQGQEAATRLMRHGLDSGLSLLDMADLYGTHAVAREAVKGIPRDKYAILTKIWPNKESWVSPSGGAKEEVDRFRRELGTEMLDICLIHCMLNERWPEQHARIRDELSALKEQGVVRAVGVSCHDFGALKRAAALPWVDGILARVNHRGGSRFACDADAESLATTLRGARANGKAVIGMKLFAAGGIKDAAERQASLRFVVGGGLVDAVTIGMLKSTEVDDNIRSVGHALKGKPAASRRSLLLGASA
jgi:1-deoxyxylulose-5-phosphate synthase